MTHTNKFLISELHRFVHENGRVPMYSDMSFKYGYPAASAYENHFGMFNNALIEAGLKINKINNRLDGTETCFYCGKRADEIVGFKNWYYNKNNDYERLCYKCGTSEGLHDYIKGELDPKSATGKAFISQRVVAKILDLELENDCNCSVNFGHPYDLYDKGRYEYINVKTSILYYNLNYNPFWRFDFKQKEIPNTYILVGFDENRKNILRVWITDSLDDLTYDVKNEKPKKSIGITNTEKNLKKAKPWEVDAKPYDDMLHQMSQKRKETNGKDCILMNNNLK